jgi:hypothetical protein
MPLDKAMYFEPGVHTLSTSTKYSRLTKRTPRGTSRQHLPLERKALGKSVVKRAPKGHGAPLKGEKSPPPPAPLPCCSKDMHLSAAQKRQGGRLRH